MRKFTLWIFMLFCVFSYHAQTTVINPSLEGGFELGPTFAANGWSVSNVTNNPWIVGAATANGVMTGNSAFISQNGTNTPNYDVALPVSNYFWRDVTIPAGQSKINLTFNWVQQGEASWDIVQVFVAPTTITPVAGGHPGSGTTNVPAAIAGATFVTNTAPLTGVQTLSVFLPQNLAGTTFRLIFLWKSDTSAGTQPPAQIDNISLTHTVPGNFVSIATGNWGSPSTWDANAVPSPVDNAFITGGTTVTVDAVNQGIDNLTVEGTLAYASAPTQFNVNGNLTVDASGIVNVFSGTTGKTLVVTKNIINEGVINISVGTGSAGNLTLNGSAVQSVSGSGVFLNNMIRNLTFANTSTATPNINWSFDNIAIATNLNITGARINLGTNKMIFGNLAAGGTLTAPVGSGFLPGARFSRWWTATATGSVITAGQNQTNTTSRYPLISPTGLDRSVYITRTNSTGAVAGELSVVYQHANSVTSGLSIADGAYTITDRFNGNWAVSNEGTAVSASSYTVAIIANDAYFASNGNSRIMNQNSALGGAHQNGTATPGVQRITIPQAALLAAPLFIGINSSDIPHVSIANGDWNTASIWSKGTVPTCTDFTTIANGTAVNVNSAGNVASSVTIASTGTLNVASGDLTVGCTNNNNLLSNNGTLTVSGGTLNVNGQLISTFGSTFNQSGGDINVDGNNNADPLTSVPSFTGIVQLNTNLLNWTGGTLTIVDPHANTSASNSFAFSATTGLHVNVTGTHTLKLGNGISTQAGGNATNGFRINTWVGSARISFANVVVDALAGTNRQVTTSTGIGINGNLTITPTSHLSTLFNTVYLAGNLVNNGKMTTTTALYLGTYLSGTIGTTSVEQTISGSGIFENNGTTSTASLSGLTVNNSSVEGVNINAPLSISGTLNFVNGFVNTTAANQFRVGTATAGGTITGMSDTRYVRGPIARTIANGNTGFVLFPVGKAGYAPISVNPATTEATVMSGEVFDANAGTVNSSIFGLAANRRWEAPILSGAASSVNVLLQDTNLVATNIPVQAPTAAGEYTNDFGSTATFVAGPPKTIQSVLAPTTYTGFVSFATSNVCSGSPIVGATLASNDTICSGENVILDIATIPVGTGISYQWQSSTDGVTYADITGATNFTYSTVPSTDLFFRNQVTCANSSLTTISTPVFVTFANDITSTTPGTRCGVGSATIGATANAGATVSWYATATGGVSLGSGVSFNTPTISTDTAFYASAEVASPQTVTLGAGAVTTEGVGQSFLPGFWGGAKTQYIIRASELNAAGIFAGPITSIGFQPTTSGQTYQGFTVQIGNSTDNTAPTVTFLSGLTTVYQGTEADNGFTPTANALNTLAFGTGTGSASAFNWDGASNVVVSFSWSRVPGAFTATGSSMLVDNVGYVVAASRQRDNITPAAMLAETSVNAFASNQFRPRFTINGTGICSSPRVMVPITFSPSPALTLSGTTTTICEGSSSTAVTVTSTPGDFTAYAWTPSTGVSGDVVSGWTFNPTTTTTYTLDAGTPATCQNSTSYEVVVTPLTSPVTFEDATLEACQGTASIVANGSAVLPSVTANVSTISVGTNVTLTGSGVTTLNVTMPALPAGAIVTGTSLVFNNVTTAPGTWPSDVTAAVSGIITAPALVVAPVNTSVTNAGPYTRTLNNPPVSGGAISVVLQNNWTGNVDFGTIELIVNYTTPNPGTLTWWTAATGGTQIGTGNTLETVGTSVLANTNTAGTFNFFAQGANGVCANPVRQLLTVTINALPTIGAGSDFAVCTGSPATVNGTGGVTYAWDNGVTNGQSFVPTAQTTYTVTGTDANGCVNTDQVVVSINALPTVVGSVNNDTVCSGTQVTLTGAGAVSYVWNNSATNATPIAVTSTTDFIVAGTDANGCVNSDTVTVTVNALPVPVITGDLVICAGDSTLLVASSETGNVWSTTATTDSIFVSTAGSITVTETDANGCVGTSAPVVIVVNALPAVNAGADYAVCQNTTTSLSGSGAVSYAWDNNVSNNIAFLVTETNDYVVTGTDANGCVNTDTITVTANALPAVNGGDNIEQCGDQSVTLTATGATAYAWSGDVENGTAFDAPFGTSVYIVTGVDAFGCSNTDAVTVSIYANPTATITPINGVTLQATPAGASYQWINCSDNQPIAGAVTPVFTATENGNYAVIVTGMGGCADTSACFNVTTVGIEKTELDASINLFPNPTTSNVTLAMSSDKAVNVTVFDAQGKVVSIIDNAQNGSIIGLQHVENGVYMVQVSNETGSKVFRVVKQ